MRRKLQLIKTFTWRNPNKYSDLKVIKILKDVETGEKFHEVIHDPKIKFYITKDEYKNNNNKIFEESIDRVYEVEARHNEIEKTIANELGGSAKATFDNLIRAKQFKDLRKMHSEPNVHGSDINIEDYYINEHYENFGDHTSFLTKSYFDIEVDSRDVEGFPKSEDALAPVNLITYFDTVKNRIHVLILRDHTNKLLMEFEKTQQDEFISYIKNKYRTNHNLNVDVKLNFFDEEIKLIAVYFYILNKNKPDFNLGWNTADFDYPYLYNRIINLGYAPEAICCHPDIDQKVVFYYTDTYQQDIADQGTYFECSNYTVFIDQMRLYANITKPMGKKDSYTLDAVSEDELGENKIILDPYNEGINIKNLVERDFWRFLEYGVHDTMLCYFLEEKNNFGQLLYQVGSMTRTRINKSMKKTISLKNYMNVFNKGLGNVLSNNSNTRYGHGDKNRTFGSIAGGFVGDPTLVGDIGVEITEGSRSPFIHSNVADQDLASLYPHIKYTFNIDVTTLIYSFEFMDEEWGKKATNYSVTNRKPHAILADDIMSRNFINLGVKYMGLKSLDDIIADPKFQKLLKAGDQ